ncbi:MAG: hypothetical protein ACI9LY_001604 [Arenicella sp.]|jgi:hypothetical protein
MIFKLYRFIFVGNFQAPNTKIIAIVPVIAIEGRLCGFVQSLQFPSSLPALRASGEFSASMHVIAAHPPNAVILERSEGSVFQRILLAKSRAVDTSTSSA